MIKHNQELVRRGAAILIQAWGTEELEVPEEMRAPFMRLIRMPVDGLVPGKVAVDALNDQLRNLYNVQVSSYLVAEVLSFLQMSEMLLAVVVLSSCS